MTWVEGRGSTPWATQEPLPFSISNHLSHQQNIPIFASECASSTCARKANHVFFPLSQRGLRSLTMTDGEESVPDSSCPQWSLSWEFWSIESSLLMLGLGLRGRGESRVWQTVENRHTETVDQQERQGPRTRDRRGFWLPDSLPSRACFPLHLQVGRGRYVFNRHHIPTCAGLLVAKYSSSRAFPPTSFFFLSFFFNLDGFIFKENSTLAI